MKYSYRFAVVFYKIYLQVDVLTARFGLLYVDLE